MGALDYLLLALLGVWLGFALRSSLRHKGGSAAAGPVPCCAAAESKQEKPPA